VTDREVLNVAVAGLCHDLGHGPFSHVFDNIFIKKLQKAEEQLTKKPQPKWTHEIASCMIFQNILDTTASVAEYFQNEFDVKMVKDLILGDPSDCPANRKWLFEIVSNPRNSIDVDKFDYLARDTQKMNVHYCSFNHEVIMKTARVIEDSNGDYQICYPQKHEFEIKKLYDSRYNLYKDCYNHRVT